VVWDKHPGIVTQAYADENGDRLLIVIFIKVHCPPILPRIPHRPSGDAGSTVLTPRLTCRETGGTVAALYGLGCGAVNFSVQPPAWAAFTACVDNMRKRGSELRRAGSGYLS
jgi:hypothetical protein